MFRNGTHRFWKVLEQIIWQIASNFLVNDHFFKLFIIFLTLHLILSSLLFFLASQRLEFNHEKA